MDGAQLHYIEHGAGAPLIFIHGSLSDYRTWQDQMAPFGNSYHVVAYSRRYHYPNATTCPTGQSPVIQQRDDLAQMINILGLAPACLVGSSFGGIVASLVALEHPELVRALILGGPPFLSLLSPTGQQDIENRVLAPSRQALDRGEVEKGIRTFLDGMITDGFYQGMQPASRQRILDNAPSFSLEQMTPFNQRFPSLTSADLSKLHSPTLLITGQHDPPYLALITERLLAAIPNIERVAIPGLSHGGLHNQNTRAYNQAVLTYLRERF